MSSPALNPDLAMAAEPPTIAPRPRLSSDAKRRAVELDNAARAERMRAHCAEPLAGSPVRGVA